MPPDAEGMFPRGGAGLRAFAEGVVDVLDLRGVLLALEDCLILVL